VWELLIESHRWSIDIILQQFHRITMRIERLQSAKSALLHFQRVDADARSTGPFSPKHKTCDLIGTPSPSTFAPVPDLSRQCTPLDENCTCMEQYRIEGDVVK
jgi:hypothetical protein